MTAPAVETDSLSCAYGARLALDRATLTVARGEIFALLGPNGGGKTTLFRILATLLRPTSGTFRVDGLDPAVDVRAVRRRLGVVFQTPGLDRKLTVEENLALQGALLGLSGAALAARIDALLGTFSIRDRARDLVETLSGGLARRVEIAKSLLAAPPVLLLDEPSTGLDPGARRDLTALLVELAKGGTAVLLTTHLFDEADAAHRIGILDRGRLVALGAPAALKAEVGGDVVTVEAREDGGAPALAREIGAHFGPEAGKVSAVGNTVRVERREAHRFVPALVEAFPGRFRSLTLGAPSLEDVFIDRTGRAFREADADEPAAAGAAA
ncbi:MAG TPA: ATP-binding cassette domain-containing protein [Thermoanaerobaculia bacterium]|nr:ATP-binding cassette domain-containing protein [Thermoanaerobaculia bacterium]